MSRGRLLVIALLAAAPLAAQPADPLADKVRALAHPRYAEREKAARELEAAGEPALKALREAARSGDAELRARATAVSEHIERTLRSQRLLTAPKLALKFDRVPLDQAVREFAAKAQLHCVLDKSKIKNPDRTVTLDTGEIPYWEAVHAFYQAAGLAEDDSPFESPKTPGARSVRPRFVESPVRNPRTPMATIRLADGQPTEPAALHSALRVRALPPGFPQNAYDDLKGQVTFHLDVEPAPGLALRELVGIEVRKATAEDGRPLAPAYPVPPAVGGLGYEEQLVLKQVMIANGNLVLDGSAGGSAQPVTLKTDGLRPKKLAELQGVVVARVVTPPEAIVTVGQFLRPGTREATADGTTVQVREVAAGTDKRVVQVRVVTRTDLADQMLNVPLQVRGRVRPFIRINRGPAVTAGQLPDLKVHDAAGQPIGGLSAQVTSMTYDGTTMVQDVRLSFEKPATAGEDKLSLVLMGRRAATVESPFVLKDVPLP